MISKSKGIFILELNTEINLFQIEFMKEMIVIKRQENCKLILN